MRRVLLIGMIIILVAAAATGGGLLYLNSTIGGRHVLALVNEMVLRDIGLRLVWEEARGSFLFNMVAENPALLMADGDTLVEARRIRIGFRPWAVLAGGIELSSVEADDPVVNILALSGGSSSRSERSTVESVQRSDSGGSGLRIRRFTIRDGAVRIGRRGVIHSIEGIMVRGALQVNPVGGLQIDIRRSRAVIEDWGMVVEDLRGELVLKKAMLWLLDTEARTMGSRLAVDGSMDMSRVGRRGAMKMQLQALDLREWWPILGGSWIGSGPLDLEGWLRGKPWRPEIEVSGGGYIAGLLVEGATLEGSYTPANLEAEIRGWGPGADMLRANLALDPRSGEGWLEVDADSLRLGNTPLEIPVSLGRIQVALQTEGYDPVASGGELHLDIWGMNAYGLEADSLNTDLQLGGGNVSTLEPLLAGGEGYEFTADGMISRDRRAINLHVRGLTREPSRLIAVTGAGIETGSIDLDAWITGAIADPDVRGRIRAQGLEREGVRIGDTDFGFNVTQVFGARIGNFGADLDSVHVEPRFDLPVVGFNGRVIGETISFQRVEGIWEEGETGLQGNITISGDSIKARFDSGHLAHRELIVSDINGQLSLNPVTGAGPFIMEATTSEGGIRLQGHMDEDRKLHVRGQLEGVQAGPFSRSFDLGIADINGRIEGTFSGQIEKHVEVLTTRIQMENPRVGDRTFDSFIVDAEYRNGAVAIDSLIVVGTADADSWLNRAGLQGTLHLPGSPSGGPDGRLELTILLMGVNLGVFQPYLPDHALIGELICQMNASGTFVQPRLDGLIILQDAQVDTFQVEEVVAGIRYGAGGLELYGGELVSMGFTSSFDVSLPLRLQLSPLEAELVPSGNLRASIAGTGNPEAILQPFRKQIESVAGDFKADIHIGGTIEEPNLSGNVRLADGELKPVAIGRAIEDLQIELALSDDAIRIVTLTGRMPSGARQQSNLWNLWNLFGIFAGKEEGGDFSVTGQVVLGGENPQFDLSLHGTGMGVSDPTGSLAAVFDSDLNLVTRQGNTFPSLEGDVQVLQGVADVGLLLDMAGGTETAREIDAEEREGLDIDVEIEIPGRLRIIGGEFGQEFDVELMGNLILRKNPTGTPYLLGSLESITGQGQLFMFSRRWTIEEGTVTFGSIEEINPNLDARFSTIIDEDVIVLTLTGTAREPVTQLSAEGNSMLGQSDILQLLALGTVGMGVEARSASQVIGTYLENAVNRTARGIIGVDTFDMEGISGLAQGSLGENTQLSVGRYFGNQVYAKYAQSLGGSSLWREFGVEYRLSRRFRISGMRDRNGIYLLELKWRIEY